MTSKFGITYEKTAHGKAPHYPYARIVCIRRNGDEHCGVDSNTLGFKSFWPARHGKDYKKKAKKFFSLAKKVPPAWKRTRNR